MFNNQYLWGYRADFWTLTESYGLKLGRILLRQKQSPASQMRGIVFASKDG